MRDDSNPTEIDSKGNKFWKLNGQLHREDGPAVIFGYCEKWYKKGVLHRGNDEPAIDFKDGHKEWYVDGLLHREKDQPAIVSHSGKREWYKHGKLHRDGDLPASINKKGDKKWYKDGLLHREGDEPAIITSKDSKKWYKNGKLHREGGKPAFINKLKTAWFLDDKNHKEDGPAIIWANGEVDCWLHGSRTNEKDENHYQLQKELNVNNSKLKKVKI
jgi:hypothetical protein